MRHDYAVSDGRKHGLPADSNLQHAEKTTLASPIHTPARDSCHRVSLKLILVCYCRRGALYLCPYSLKSWAALFLICFLFLPLSRSGHSFCQSHDGGLRRRGQLPVRRFSRNLYRQACRFKRVYVRSRFLLCNPKLTILLLAYNTTAFGLSSHLPEQYVPRSALWDSNIHGACSRSTMSVSCCMATLSLRSPGSARHVFRAVCLGCGRGHSG
jgi:hypothetical protein